MKAMTELDGTNFKGRILHILPAIEPKTEDKQKGKAWRMDGFYLVVGSLDCILQKKQ